MLARGSTLVGAWLLAGAAVAAPADFDPCLPEPAIPVEDMDEFDPVLGPSLEVCDPLEPVNRVSFEMNRGIDRAVIAPIARTYGFVLPGSVRGGVRRVLANLALPAVAANYLLQIRPLAASRTLGRLVVNTTVGVLGIFDPASRIGWGPDPTGFGETLATYHVPSGPYLVLPVLGPSRPRDAAGRVTDLLLRPDTWFFGMGPALAVASGSAITEREANDSSIRQLEALVEGAQDG